MPTRLSIPALAAAVLIGGCAQRAEPPGPPAETRGDLMSSVMGVVRTKYVEPVQNQQLVEGALKGMLRSLDPHSDYMTELDYRDFLAEASGSFGGIGIEIGQQEEQLAVVAPIDGTPAARAGILAGDRIVTIDGKSTAGLSLPDSVRLLRGPVGAPVTLGIQRGDEAPFDVTLMRQIIEVDPVEWRLERGMGYIRLRAFTERSAEGVHRAIESLRRESGGRLRGLVLDLRNDPGGLLEQAVAVSDMFLDRGRIVSVKAREPGGGQVYRAEPGDLTGGAPVVVLINGGSASAAEIVAGALQDNRRATVVGTPSFGKGSVQTVIPLDDGGALRLTTALYYTPSGRSIQAVGITPDVIVASTEVLEPDQREADLIGALPNGGRNLGPSAARSSPAPARPAAAEGEAVDEPLERALRLLGAG